MPTPDHVGVGVRVGSTRPVAAVTVRNVRFVGLDVGVSVSNAEDVRISGVGAEGVATGILVTSSGDVFVTDSVVVGSADDGVVVRDSTGVVVADTTVEDGLVAGVVLESVEDGRLTRVRARGNDGDGLLVAESDGVALDASRAEANGVGLLLMDSHGVAVTGLVAERNEFAGVGLVRSDGNRIRDVRVGGTTGRRPVLDAPSDLWLYASSENCAENVSVEGGGGWVVYMRDGSTDNRVAALTDGLSSVSFVGSDVAVAFGDGLGRSSGGAPVVEPTGSAWSYDPATASCS
jgi:nitrous oxidase accessory protein NosD